MTDEISGRIAKKFLHFAIGFGDCKINSSRHVIPSMEAMHEDSGGISLKTLGN